MTGPEHYREAENALAALGTELYAPARRGLTKGLGPSDLLAYAQVHATLALAAATAFDRELYDVWQWQDVAGRREGGAS